MPILIPVAEGAVEVGEAAEAATKSYEAYRAKKALEAAAKLAAAAQAAREGPQTEACSTCEPPPEDPCKHLERSSGTGRYRGGSHRQMTKPAKDGLESHHMPPVDSIKGKLSKHNGAAIQREEMDHEKTSS